MEEEQDIRLFSRRRMELSGITEVGGFTDEQITLTSTLGDIAIEGHGLKIESFSTDKGELIINGDFDGLYYFGRKDDGEKRGFFKKLLR